MTTKICTKCNEKKELQYFYKDSEKKDGYKSHCKSCIVKKLNKNKTSEELSKYEYRVKSRTTNVVHKEGGKECTLCKQEKEYSLFPINKATKDGYGSKCKQCDAWNHANKKAKEIDYASFYMPI